MWGRSELESMVFASFFHGFAIGSQPVPWLRICQFNTSVLEILGILGIVSLNPALNLQMVVHVVHDNSVECGAPQNRDLMHSRLQIPLRD
jgi:hypothetical protein